MHHPSYKSPNTHSRLDLFQARYCWLWIEIFIVLYRHNGVFINRGGDSHAAEATFGSYAESPPPEDRTIGDKIFAR